jgi:ABC-type nickel/cobalt efflux system permease component RcnA
MRRGTLIAGLLLLAPLGAVAHPLTPGHHDRAVLIQVGDTELLVDYTLALDGWTLAQSLVPFRKEFSADAKPQDLYAAFARIHGPMIAQGMLGTLGGKALQFEYVDYQLRIEDHFRYTFRLRAVFPERVGKVEQPLVVEDTNFALEPGEFRLAARGLAGVTLLQSNAPTTIEDAKPIILQEAEPEAAERLRTLRALVVQTTDTPPVSSMPEPVPPPPSAPESWEIATSLDASRLLSSDFGLAILLVLAFIFGAAHALQPGHGKTLVAAYLVGERGTVWHAFFLGLVTTFTHTFMVIFLALILPWTFPDAQPEVAFALSLGSGLLVVLLAIWLILRRLGGQADHVHFFGGHHHAPRDGKVTLWALTTLGITGGLVPCVDALGLLATTVVLNKLWLGLPLTLAFSAGLASVLVAIGVVVVKFKKLAASRFGAGRLARWLPLASAVATLLLGLWMCHEALRQRDALDATRLSAKASVAWLVSEVPHASR